MTGPSANWQAMLSADEAMLGGIPDREAPLPYIPKAKPSVLSRRVTEFQDVLLHRTQEPSSPAEAYPHSFALSPPQSYVVKAPMQPGFPQSSGTEVFSGNVSPLNYHYDVYPQAVIHGRMYQSTVTGGHSRSESPCRNATSVPAPLEPDWRGNEAWQRNIWQPPRQPLGCTIGYVQAPAPAPGLAAFATVPAGIPAIPAVPSTMGGLSSKAPTVSSSSTAGTCNSQAAPACCAAGATNGSSLQPRHGVPGGSVPQALPIVTSASVVPAVAAPPSPCMSSCGTPQSPCRSVQFVSSQAPMLLTSASVVPAVVAPPSPCMSPCGTPQSPCRSVQFVRSQAPMLLTSASVVPAVVAPPSPCMSPCGTPQSPCRSVQSVNPQVSTMSTSASVFRSPIAAVPSVGVGGPVCYVSTAATSPSWSSPFTPARPVTQAPLAASVATVRERSPLRCLPVKYSRQDRDPVVEQSFESILAEARKALKEKVEKLMASHRTAVAEVKVEEKMQKGEDNELPKKSISETVESEFPSLAKLEALLAQSSKSDSPRSQFSSKAPAIPAPTTTPLKSMEFPSLAKLEALLAESSERSDSPQRRPSDMLRCQQDLSSKLERLEQEGLSGPTTPHTTWRDTSTLADWDSLPLRRPLFVGSQPRKEEQSTSSRTSQDLCLKRQWLDTPAEERMERLTQDFCLSKATCSSQAPSGIWRSSLLETRVTSLPTMLTQAHEFNKRGADVAGGLRAEATEAAHGGDSES